MRISASRTTAHSSRSPCPARPAASTRSDHNVSEPALPQPACTPPKISRSRLLKTGLLVAGGSTTGLLASQPSVSAIPEASAVETIPALVDLQSISKVVLTTLSDCDLRVGFYPTFSYNATGGGGTGTVAQRPDGLLDVAWDAASLTIPPISLDSTRILGLPLPPPLQIKIVPEALSGTVDPWSGVAELEFLARFEFSAGPLYTAAPLIVSTTLTTEGSKGAMLEGRGERLGANGRVRLAGVASVPPNGDVFLEKFLVLPTDALAVLSAELKFT